MSRRLYQLSYRPAREANYSRKAASWSSPSGAGLAPASRPERSRQGKGTLESRGRSLSASGAAGEGQGLGWCRLGALPGEAQVVRSCTGEDQGCDDDGRKNGSPGLLREPCAITGSCGGRLQEAVRTNGAGLPAHTDSPGNRELFELGATWRRRR